MSAFKDAGPAFPQRATDSWGVDAQGMSLRDYFAAKAMQGLASDPSVQETAEEMAVLAYALADAMIEARGAP
jgi:hypothetical protein